MGGDTDWNALLGCGLEMKAELLDITTPELVVRKRTVFRTGVDQQRANEHVAELLA